MQRVLYTQIKFSAILSELRNGLFEIDLRLNEYRPYLPLNAIC